MFHLLLGQEVLEELVHRPGDGSGGHLVYNPSLGPLKEGRQTPEAVHCPEGVGHPRQLSADVNGAEHYVLLSVQESFTNVQRSGDRCGDGSRRGPRHDVTAGVVMSVGVQLLLHQLVDHDSAVEDT